MFTKFRLSSNLLCFLVVFVFAVVIFSFDSCREKNRANTVENDIADGKQLAAKYCVSCHQLPDPLLIDRQSWERGVLPAMAKRLHINSYMGHYFSDERSALNIVD